MRSLSYNRRVMLQAGGASTGYSLGRANLGLPSLAQEAEPRAPAHHRFSIGSHEIFVLSDGHLVLPTSMLAGNVPETEVRSFLTQRAIGPDRTSFHINVALLKTGDDYTLI